MTMYQSIDGPEQLWVRYLLKKVSSLYTVTISGVEARTHTLQAL